MSDDANELRDVLLHHGFVPCDIPACNCGSWHARFGYPVFDVSHWAPMPVGVQVQEAAR